MAHPSWSYKTLVKPKHTSSQPTIYNGAQLVLDDARRDAAEQNYETKQMWKDAKISAVNLEFGLKLSSGKPKAKAQNNQKYDTVYDIIPSFIWRPGILPRAYLCTVVLIYWGVIK